MLIKTGDVQILKVIKSDENETDKNQILSKALEESKNIIKDKRTGE